MSLDLWALRPCHANVPELSIFPGPPLSLVLRIVKAVATVFSDNHLETRIDKLRGNNSCVILLSNSSWDARPQPNRSHALSFTNFSAAGLGDILPITSLARVLVILEQFAGVAYIALLVSRLIGLTIVHRDRWDLP